MGRFFFPNGNIYYKLIFKLFFSSRSGILRIISIMSIYRKLNYGTAFDISSSFYIGSAPYQVTINGLLCVSISTSSQPGPHVNLRIVNSGTASSASPVFATWGHNGGGAEYNIAPFAIPVFAGNG